MEFRRQLGVLRAWWWLLVGSLVLAGGAGLSSCRSTCRRSTRGTSTLNVGQGIQAANPDLNQLLASQRLSQTYAELATTSPRCSPR